MNNTSPQSNTTKVSIVRAETYNVAEIRTAIGKSLDLIGGIGALVKPGSKVFVKINHLSPPSPAEKGIVTHPIFTEAVLDILKQTGAEITVGDDIEEGDEDGFVISGYREMCQRAGLKLVNLREGGFSALKCQGKVLPEIYISNIVQDADVIINLPKFKTHSLTTFTGGVKNLYGVIPAGVRRRFHGEYIRIEDFCQALVDIFSMAKPHLTIMDGIVAMEGEGPGSGHLRKLGVTLASRDAVSVDAVAGKIIGLEPEYVLTTKYSNERGLGVGDLAKIQVVGEKLEAVAIRDFKFPTLVSRISINRIPSPLVKFILGQVSPRPWIRKKNCTACGECVNACPTGAATIDNKKAHIDDKLCIRCMCCHEVCRYNAVIPRRPFVGETIFGMVGAIRKVVKI